MIKKVSDGNAAFVFDELMAKFNRSRERHGMDSFNSPWEIQGKLDEENLEVLTTIHDKRFDLTYNELYDVAITALFGIMSMRAWKGLEPE